ncbi:MAG: hypothetical protein JRF28_05435 [Deltaproteobacteria bacterium]|nr:hypothetical protein [Deltaproteobacteria bacterium]
MKKRFPIPSYVLAALLCFLVVKLGLTGILVCTRLPVLPLSIWQSDTALAKDGQDENIDKKKVQTEKVGGKSPTLNRQSNNSSPEALEVKRLQLEEERAQLDEERKRLEALKNEIDEKLSKVTKIQAVIQKELGKKEDASHKRIKHLIKVYEAMPPKKAAVLIEKLSMEVIIALFSQMKGEDVGQILPYVSPEKAAKISERLATLGH